MLPFIADHSNPPIFFTTLPFYLFIIAYIFDFFHSVFNIFFAFFNLPLFKQLYFLLFVTRTPFLHLFSLYHFIGGVHVGYRRGNGGVRVVRRVLVLIQVAALRAARQAHA